MIPIYCILRYMWGQIKNMFVSCYIAENYWSGFLFKVCRQSRKTFLLLYCLFFIKGLPTKSEDLSVFVLFLIIFFILSFFSLPPSACLDFSLISQPISMKFGMLIVLDERKRCLKFQVNRTRGRDMAWSQSLLCFIIGKTLYTVRRDKNFT